MDATQTAHTTSPNVLLVERDLGFADALATAFTTAGFTVRHVVNGVEAIEAVEETTPDLLVLDLDTPIISGPRLIALLRESGVGHDIPVLALATFSFREAGEALQTGADDVLIKPLPPDEVVVAGQELLRLAQRWEHATLVPLA